MIIRTTTLTPEEELLLLGFIHNIMNGATKVMSDNDGNMNIKNENFSMWLTPEDIETFSCLLSKYDMFDDYLCQVTDWIMED